MGTGERERGEFRTNCPLTLSNSTTLQLEERIEGRELRKRRK
jgi:hypothetical protein